MKGFHGGLTPPLLRPVNIAYPTLPRHLDGLTILQLSDLHLGLVRRLDDLESLLSRMRSVPDLIVFTGDVADDRALLEPALRLARAASPRVGVFSVLGNHEWLHDGRFAMRAHERAGVPLLLNEGMTVQVGSSKLWVAGIDDPEANPREFFEAFLEKRVASSLQRAPTSAFKLLLSHRPEGFTYGRAHGADLTLAGHTHGGQLGFNGKSAFERIWPERYLWGGLERSGSHLYTTSGFGHWFPFRLGCEAEAPILSLGGPARPEPCVPPST